MIASQHQGGFWGKMALRYLGAACAMLYGLLLGHAVVVQGLAYGFRSHDVWRLAMTLIALFGAAATVAGLGRRYLIGTMMILVLVEIPTAIFVLPAVLGGTWQYHWFDWSLFAFLFLPMLGLLAVLSADGGWGKFVATVRTYPHKQDF